MTVPAVELRAVRKTYGPAVAVDRVSLAIPPGEFFTLLGASGCGKTTTLRLIAGFELPTEGEVRIGGADMSAAPPHLRPVHTVFQSYALFPHLTVRENVEFPLRVRRRPAAERKERALAALDLVRMRDFAERRPAALSGGQQQRVALARALVNEPQVLLLDEPLGALDLKLRKEMQTELKHMQRRLGITFVFVTHDQEEALTMSDRIALMRDGRVLQIGDPASIYDRPETRYAAEFIGETNLLPAALLGEAGGVTVAVRPEALAPRPPGSDLAGSEAGFDATLRETVFVGSDRRLVCALDDGTPVVARVQNRGEAGAPPTPGERLLLVCRRSDLRRLAD